MTSIIRTLSDFCAAEHDWLVETIETLVRLESPTTDKAAVDRCGGELQARLERIGGRVARLPQRERGDHLRAEFTPARPAKVSRSILLLGHFDTVWPVGQIERMPLERRGGRLHGPGVYDMKAGVGIAMLAVRALMETGAGISHRIVMLWTTDEEVGSGTSREAIEAEARRSDAVLVLEPSLPGGAVKTARKGCAGFEVTVHGVSAHAGIEPQKGASAVEELAHQIPRINAMQDLERGVNVNVVQAWGGARANVIPDEAHALVDVRVPDVPAWERVRRAFADLVPVDSRTRIEARGWFDRPPLERTAAVARLYDQARGVARDLGADLGEGGTGGGSDGNFTAALGVPTLDGLGAVGDGAHALHEHVEIGALPGRAALVAGLILKVSAPGGAEPSHA
ncbi:MAG: M20 family metallopeptidase [Betaproteobacteria bacterium]